MSAPSTSGFAARFNEGSRALGIVQRVAVVATLLHVVIGACSSYRAWVQVRSVEVRVPATNLRPGLQVLVHVVTWGRTPVNVRLDMNQNGKSETLDSLRVAPSRDGFYDPRTRQGTMTPVLTSAFLSKFHAGPATLRATAIGRPQWLRLPPPKVQEVAVVVDSTS